MDFVNSSFYRNITDAMNGTQNKFAHDENQETAMVDALRYWKQAACDLYYRSLLNPEVHGAKIPSRLPVESAIAQLHDNFTISPNSSGLFLLVIDPFKSSGYLYQSDTLDGHGTAGTVTTLTFNQNASIIDQWRLVSSSLILRYYGDFNTMSGLFVSATTSNISNHTAAYYADFQNIEDLTNKSVTKCMDGLKLVYCPMDEKATDFHAQSTYTGTHPCDWQYLFVVCGYMLPNSSNCIRVDYFRNIEYTSVPAYKEYIVQEKEIGMEYSVPPIVTTASVAPKEVTVSRPSVFRDMVRTVAMKLNPLMTGAIDSLVSRISSGFIKKLI